MVEPWVQRGGGAPYVPGNPQEIVECLRAVLRAVDEHEGVEHELTWPSDGTTVLHEAVRFGLSWVARFTCLCDPSRSWCSAVR
ncbi:hypothetical protein AB0H12_33390 [Actinosynnema sp. NPDC023794]